MAKKTHIPIAGSQRTYCGLRFSDGGIAVIDLGRVSIESATCRNCQKSDDRRVVETHQRECREAGIDPFSLEPLPKTKPLVSLTEAERVAHHMLAANRRGWSRCPSCGHSDGRATSCLNGWHRSGPASRRRTWLEMKANP